jgi:hypothetical protein
LETGRFVEKVGVDSVADVSECTPCIVGFDAVSLLDCLTRAFGKSESTSDEVVKINDRRSGDEARIEEIHTSMNELALI